MATEKYFEHTPKTRDELFKALAAICGPQMGLSAKAVVEVIEKLGLRIVPAEPTEEMTEACGLDDDLYPEDVARDVIAASPFTPK